MKVRVCLALLLSVVFLVVGISFLYGTTGRGVRRERHKQAKLTEAELGDYYLHKHYQTINSNPSSSISDLKQSVKHYVSASLLYQAAGSLAKIGQIYTTLGMHQLALEYLLEVNQMLQKQPKSAQAAWLCSDIGNVYFAMELTDLAEPYYWQGLRVMKSLGDVFGQSVMLNNLGLCKMKQAKPDSALAYYSQALILRESTKDRFSIYHSLNYLGEANHKLGNLDIALQFYNKVFDDLSVPAQPIKESIALRVTSALSLQKLYLELEKPDLADRYLETALNILISEKDSFRLNSVLVIKAKRELERGSLTKAIDIYKDIYATAHKHSFLEQAKDAAYELETIYLTQNDAVLASKYMSIFKAYNDSLFALRSPETLFRLHSSVQNNLKELQNRELVKKQQLTTRLSILIFVLLLVIILLFIKSNLATKRNSQRLRQLAEASFEGILMHKNGIIVEVNDRLWETLGITREDCIGHHVTEITNLKVDESINEHVKTGGIQNYEIEVVSAHKGLLNIEIMSRPYTYVKNKVRVVAIRDITEQKKFITTLLETQKQLSELNATKDRLFSIIAHDLKNPFSAIIGFSEVIRNNLDKFTTEQLYDMIVQVHETSTTAYVLLKNLLEWAKIQIGAVNIFPNNHRLLPIIQTVVSLLKAPLNAKEISLKVNCPEDIHVFADAQMLHSILNNLVTNALKFTQHNGEITITAIHEKATIIDVRDTGIGMDDDTQDSLFKIESICSRKGTDNESGTGIGL
ncbi:MAG: tetratricopeptide repeat protein, partial [Candidatus Cloacimonetes bacterium]|nr:tetratricopeptide repeat protein [Candidatus Cloacimonadota bacterium]